VIIEWVVREMLIQKCGRPFNSIDRKYIRLCWNCKISNKKLKGGLETRNVKLREE